MLDPMERLLSEIEAELNCQNINDFNDIKDRLQSRIQYKNFQQQSQLNLAEAEQHYQDIYNGLSPQGRMIADEVERLAAIAYRQGLRDL